MDEVVTVGAHDHRAVEVQGPSGRLYRSHDGGLYDMTPGDAKAFLREGAFKTGVGTPGATVHGGHVCPRGHHNFLPTCGRCKDGSDDGRSQG